MKCRLKIEGDVLSVELSEVEDSAEGRGRVCNIELALLHHYGSHDAQPVKPSKGGGLFFHFVRGSSDHRLLGECREILRGFALEV